MTHPLTDEQYQRYSRQILLPPVGESGQGAIADSKVLCVGAGGLGSPVALYLVASGIGTLGVVDFDTVDISNLQRQILFDENAVGRGKVASASNRLQGLNSDCTVVPHNARLTADTVDSVIADYDVVVDGSDNFSTRYLVNKSCVRLGKRLVSGALYQFGGQVLGFDFANTPKSPCYACVFPTRPAVEQACDSAGVFAPTAGVIGAMMAGQVLKMCVGMNLDNTDWDNADLGVGQMVTYDGLGNSTHAITLSHTPDCAVCGGVS